MNNLKDSLNYNIVQKKILIKLNFYLKTYKKIKYFLYCRMSQTITQPNAEEQLPQQQKTSVNFKATELTISTCTIISNLNAEINLQYFSRFVNIYNIMSPELELKSGGIYSLEYGGNFTNIDNIKEEFGNQATAKFKYWGFRNVNVKIFGNGRLQMTGLKSEDESTLVSKLIIDIIKNIELNIVNDDINKFNNVSNASNSLPLQKDFGLVYDSVNKKINYYRKNYKKLINCYNVKNIDFQEVAAIKPLFKYPEYSDKLESKYIENLQNNASLSNNLNNISLENVWYGDASIVKEIYYLELYKNNFTTLITNLLANANGIEDIKNGMDDIASQYLDFKTKDFNKLFNDICNNNLFSNENDAMQALRFQIESNSKDYKKVFIKKINKLIKIRNTDILICNEVEKYITANLETTFNNTTNTIKYIELDKFLCKGVEKNYFVSSIKTVLINSDYSINHSINLKVLSKLLKKHCIFNSYEPDEYPGVLTKFYYNSTNKIQGICNCTPHCSTKEKKSVCIKITISIFRPGSIIITGARDRFQLMSAYNLINKFLKDNIETIKSAPAPKNITAEEEELRNIALMNNEFRKISRKSRLFYIKKSNIIDYPGDTVK